ncbi:MAG: acyltransferase [Nitrospirae bacterium]|nr:MAG: acyltransferase [Nitrospirota bacterium]
MKAGFCQINTIFGKKAKNLEKVASMLEDVKADLIVLPEFFATGYQFTDIKEVEALAEPVPEGETTKALLELSKQRGMYIVAGLPEVSRDGKYYNSAVFTGPDGFVGLYRKSHLFFEEKLFFTPGDTGFKVWNTDIGRIGIMICFDWFFPEAMRSLALQGAQLVAHPANLVLPYCPDAMPTRCLENRVFAITANRTGREERGRLPLSFIGQSEIVGPDGRIIVRASGDKEEVKVKELDITEADRKEINQFNDLFKDRRTDLYRL